MIEQTTFGFLFRSAFLLAYASTLSAQSNVFPTSGNVGIGTTSPTAPLVVDSTITTTAPGGASIMIQGSVNRERLVLRSTNGGAFVNALNFNGSVTNPTPATQGQFSGFGTGGYDGTNWANTAYVFGVIGENWTPTAHGSYLQFEVTPNGSISRHTAMTILGGGNVGIGTSAPQHRLSVNGTVAAKEIVVTGTGWADHVFKSDYRRKTLEEIAEHIRVNHRLPGMPSEAEVGTKGVSLGETQVKLLEKIEELTLHLIETNRQIAKANKRIEVLERAHVTASMSRSGQ